MRFLSLLRISHVPEQNKVFYFSFFLNLKIHKNQVKCYCPIFST